MSNKWDRKIAQRITTDVIRFRGGWKKSVSWRKRRKYRKQIYRAILNNIEKMNAGLFDWICNPRMPSCVEWKDAE